MDSQILLYQSEDGKISVNTLMQEENIWLSQKSMAQLFDSSVDNVALHLKNIFETAELSEKRTSEDFSVVQKEGLREVSRTIKHYNLDAVISVGYRVNSLRGTQFRIWATQRVKEYLLQGFSLNEAKLKTGKSTEYFDKLQEKFDLILQMNRKNLLTHYGKISHALAVAKAEKVSITKTRNPKNGKFERTGKRSFEHKIINF